MDGSTGHGEGSDLSALLLLADGRFPSGAHAHSGTFEAIATLEGVDDVASMEEFLTGRLHTVGLVAASFAAAACVTVHGLAPDATRAGTTTATPLEELDVEFDARTPSPALREASRRLGRQVLRAGRAIWPASGLDACVAPRARLHQPVALGTVAGAAGLGPDSVALAAAHDAVIGPATAAVRLLGLDPFSVHATLARLSPTISIVAAQGARHAHTPRSELPASSAPLLDIAAEFHSTWEVRLFAS